MAPGPPRDGRATSPRYRVDPLPGDERERTDAVLDEHVVHRAGLRRASMPFEIDRALYARMYGPIVGDRVQLGDTNLLVEVERDEASPGDETPLGLQ